MKIDSLTSAIRELSPLRKEVSDLHSSLPEDNLVSRKISNLRKRKLGSSHMLIKPSRVVF